MIFFTSDLHINHKKIIDFCPARIKMFNIDPKLVEAEKELRKQRQRDKQMKKKLQRKQGIENEAYQPCPVIVQAHDKAVKDLMQAHNQGIVDKLNKIVRKRDTLYIVGDYSFGAVGEAKKWLRKMNGRKVLILGNHDRPARVMLEMGFDDVFENHELKLANKYKILLSHFPYYPTLYYRIRHWLLYRNKPDKRYLHKRIKDGGKWLLHGHTHDEEKFKMGKRSIHVGIDAWGEPVSEVEILRIVQEKQ